MGQAGGFLGKLLGPLPKTEFPFMKYLLKPLARTTLTPLGLTVVAAERDAAVDKNWFVNKRC